MNARAALRNLKLAAPANDDAFAESYPIAVFICAIGYFLHILVSGPVLNILGINYGSDDSGLLGRIHPGSYLVILSMLVLLCSRRNPIEQTIRIARQHTAFFSLLVIYILIIIYWVLRGPRGVGMIVDVHIVMPICAIVFSYAPRLWYKPIVYLFATLAVANSVIGLVEAATHMRLFPFDPEWEVLQQDYFRASALMGHPLVNAIFNGTSLFALLCLRMPGLLKSLIFMVMLAAMVAFGGRSALTVTLAGLVILGMIECWKYFMSRGMSVLRLASLFLALLLIPAVCGGLLYGVMHSGIGERLMAYDSLEDDSASVRLASISVVNFMTTDDIIFGMDGDQIAAIGQHAGIGAPTSDIENPWILMFMFLGALIFPIWLCGLFCCMWRLMSGAPPALKIGLIAYFCMSSTSNSFGRKDPVYMLLPGIIVCIKRLKEQKKI